MPKNVMRKNCLNLTHHWCERVIDSPDEDLERDCPYFCQKTNADRIRAMTDEELAWELMSWRIEAVAKYFGVESNYPKTKSAILEWLRQPVKENDHAQG